MLITDNNFLPSRAFMEQHYKSMSFCSDLRVELLKGFVKCSSSQHVSLLEKLDTRKES